MLLQTLDDVTITIKDDPPYAFVLGRGETFTLPVHLALKVVLEAPKSFRIMQPAPLLPKVSVRWLSGDDSVRGPGIVQLVDGEPPNRRISVQIGGELLWIHERDVTAVDPWSAIEDKLEEAVDLAILEGQDSPRFREIQEYLVRHFDDEAGRPGG